ncbi:MAG: beta-propeller fold lactonase family protein [Terracidiphilus sp.]|nr:beta-propeller fold lactonase family protein [Terracidiphilus sp.]MDR3798210.1 beta-propeller fold lactonase family protein [Terracidiphilus sp.]
MKFSRSSQLLLVAAASLVAASLITACETLTVDFVFVASTKAAGANSYGEIDVFEINSESGRMRQIPTSPFPSEGRNPVAEAVSADDQNLFVVNHDDNTIVQFIIGNDGKLYPYNTVNTPGIFPLAIAASKSNVFVVDTYQPLPLCSPADPCSGSIAVYQLTAATSSAPIGLGTAVNNPAVNAQFWPLTLTGANASHVVVPTAVNVLASGAYVYVIAYDSSVTPSAGYVFAFSVGSGGALTAVPGSPFAAGVKPSAIASDAKSAYLYVTDSVRGNVLGYSVGSAGALTALSGSPYPAGNDPTGVVVDPSYAYAYVANSTDATVTAYSMSSTGVLTRIKSYATGLQPVAIGIDPSTNHFLFTVNFLDNTVSDFELSTTAGTLLDAQFSPYVTNDQPVAAAAIPHNGTGGGVQSK